MNDSEQAKRQGIEDALEQAFRIGFLPHPEPGYQWVIVNREWMQVPEMGKWTRVESFRSTQSDPDRFWLGMFLGGLIGIFLPSIIGFVVRLLF